MALSNNPTPNELVKAVKDVEQDKVSSSDLKNYEYYVTADGYFVEGADGKLSEVGGSVANIYDPLQGATQDFGTLARANALQPIYRAHNNLVDKVATKQDIINDLATIRSGASAGATAVQPLDLLNLIFPIGSIYIGDENSSSPASWIGGTWQQIEGKFLLASGSSYTAGATGGEATHTLTTGEMPSHNHRLLTVNTWSGNAVGLKDTLNSTGNYNTRGIAGVEQTSGNTRYVTRSSSNQNYVENTGGGQAHNNMPPYLVVKVWQRTA